MTGSTLIHEPDESRLRDLTSLDDIGDLCTLELNALATIDFQQLVEAASASWVGDEPVFFDEEGGAAIFKVDPAGLRVVLSANPKFGSAQTADLQSISDFVAEHGVNSTLRF